jgi:hypothetical protein
MLVEGEGLPGGDYDAIQEAASKFRIVKLTWSTAT